ncbi:MAG TPA: isoprenylcysteine carboxylmethyltransferase family protein, partial [Mycobacterium sp.]|nr:isoprenylcysteine carboxylmethyltransferase family protein [Mycobacterium sp.]
MKATIAADIALVLFAVFGVLGFGWRSWLQYRRTGSSGFRGTSGRIGSTEWIAGVGFVVALMVAVSAPILQRANVIQPISILTTAWI